jgi:hypothetical protein
MTPHEVGVIADTHGLLRPEAVAALRGVEHILHAGDVGSPEVLRALAGLAPVTAVRGNNDRGPWAPELPLTVTVEVGDVTLYVLHDLRSLALDPRAAGLAAVIAGHSHQPRQQERDGILYFNPGSAGPRRFRLPVCVGRLVIGGARITARLVDLGIPA